MQTVVLTLMIFLPLSYIYRRRKRLGSEGGSGGGSTAIKRGYTEEELAAAVADICSGKLGTRRAAVLYGIPRSTLRNKVTKMDIHGKNKAAAASFSNVNSALTNGMTGQSNQCQQKSEHGFPLPNMSSSLLHHSINNNPSHATNLQKLGMRLSVNGQGEDLKGIMDQRCHHHIPSSNMTTLPASPLVARSVFGLGGKREMSGPTRNTLGGNALIKNSASSAANENLRPAGETNSTLGPSHPGLPPWFSNFGIEMLSSMPKGSVSKPTVTNMSDLIQPSLSQNLNDSSPSSSSISNAAAPSGSFSPSAMPAAAVAADVTAEASFPGGNNNFQNLLSTSSPMSFAQALASAAAQYNRELTFEAKLEELRRKHPAMFGLPDPVTERICRDVDLAVLNPFLHLARLPPDGNDASTSRKEESQQNKPPLENSTADQKLPNMSDIIRRLAEERILSLERERFSTILAAMNASRNSGPNPFLSQLYAANRLVLGNDMDSKFQAMKSLNFPLLPPGLDMKDIEHMSSTNLHQLNELYGNCFTNLHQNRSRSHSPEDTIEAKVSSQEIPTSTPSKTKTTFGDLVRNSLPDHLTANLHLSSLGNNNNCDECPISAKRPKPDFNDDREETSSQRSQDSFSESINKESQCQDKMAERKEGSVSSISGQTSGSESDQSSSTAVQQKRTRPKRGQYRKYNTQHLLEAVRAVQRGEMSVHRAGSYYGVPHSTLEYKVKERHLLRQKKKAEQHQQQQQQQNNAASPSSLSSSSSSKYGCATAGTPDRCNGKISPGQESININQDVPNDLSMRSRNSDNTHNETQSCHPLSKSLASPTLPSYQSIQSGSGVWTPSAMAAAAASLANNGSPIPPISPVGLTTACPGSYNPSLSSSAISEREGGPSIPDESTSGIDLENYCNSPSSFALNTPASQLLRKLQQRVIEKEKIQKQLALAMISMVQQRQHHHPQQQPMSSNNLSFSAPSSPAFEERPISPNCNGTPTVLPVSESGSNNPSTETHFDCRQSPVQSLNSFIPHGCNQSGPNGPHDPPDPNDSPIPPFDRSHSASPCNDDQTSRCGTPATPQINGTQLISNGNQTPERRDDFPSSQILTNPSIISTPANSCLADCEALIPPQ